MDLVGVLVEEFVKRELGRAGYVTSPDGGGDGDFTGAVQEDRVGMTLSDSQEGDDVDENDDEDRHVDDDEGLAARRAI